MAITLRQESATGATTKGSALTFAELDNNFIDVLQNKIQPLQVDADTGSVTVGEAQSNGVLNIIGGTNVTTAVTEDSAGNANITITASGSTGLADVVDDTTPQLGGMLDVNGNSLGDGSLELLKFTETASAVNELTITNAATTGNPKLSATGDDTNITLDLESKGTGHVEVRGDTNAGTIQLNCEANSHGQKIRSQPHSEAVTNTMLLPKGGDSTLVSEIAEQTLTQKTLKDYKETIYDLGTTDTPTLTVSNGNVQSLTITSGLTLPEFSDAEPGHTITLLVSGTGSVTGSTSSSGNEYLFAGGNKTLTNDSIISIVFDGGNYLASIATDFQA